MWMSKVGSRCSDGIEAGCLECWDCGALHQVLIKRQEAEKCADLWARTEQETRFTEKSKNRLRHRTDFLGQTQFFASTSCSSDAESFNQFPASASTGFFRNSHQCTSRVVYCLNLLELEHFVFEFCFGNTGIGFFIWKNKNSATNISEESQIEQLTITGSKPIQTPRSPSRPYCVTELNSKKNQKQTKTVQYKTLQNISTRNKRGPAEPGPLLGAQVTQPSSLPIVLWELNLSYCVWTCHQISWSAINSYLCS